MAEKDPNKRPIIIKKIKKGGHAHHGGAWKVAYADFVTAMMAFFLLLWLLSSTPKPTLDGLAEYFTPTKGIKDSVGIGIEGKGPGTAPASTPGIVVGAIPPGTQESEKQSQSEAQSEDGQMFDAAKNDIKKAFESDPSLREFADNILVEQTPEGLKIEIMDSDKEALYARGTAEISPFGQRILGKMKDVIAKMPNFISVTGHTDAGSEAGTNPNFTSWELSVDRANAARRYLLKVGMDVERTKKIVGMADKELIDPNDPRAAKNRRITIILLRDSHMNLAPQYVPADRDILSVSPQAAPEVPAPAPAVKAPAAAPAPAAMPKAGGH